MTTERITETQLEEIERLSIKPDLDEPKQAQAWAQRVAPLLPDLIEEVQRLREAGGGKFGQRLRDALEEQILQQLNGRTELTKSVRERSITLSVLAEAVIVDVRLEVDTWK